MFLLNVQVPLADSILDLTDANFKEEPLAVTLFAIDAAYTFVFAINLEGHYLRIELRFACGEYRGSVSRRGRERGEEERGEGLEGEGRGGEMGEGRGRGDRGMGEGEGRGGEREMGNDEE